MEYVKLYESQSIALDKVVETPAIVMQEDEKWILPIPASVSEKVTIIKDTVNEAVINYKKYINGPANNEIWYTSTDGNIVEPVDISFFEGTTSIISNTYENGKGVIIFDSNISKITDGSGSEDGPWSAFASRNNLKSIILPDSITYIGDFTFGWCQVLESVTLPKNLISIGAGIVELYSWMTNSLSEITLPVSLISIGNSIQGGIEFGSSTKIKYEGTISQWNKISIGNTNLFNSGTIIYCSDGTVTLD